MSWTQPVCDSCWRSENPDREPVRAMIDEVNVCCCCGLPTTSGIWVRKDPAKVPYPV